MWPPIRCRAPVQAEYRPIQRSPGARRDSDESRDAKAAEWLRLHLRATSLYRQAQVHAMTAREQESPGFAARLRNSRAADRGLSLF